MNALLYCYILMSDQTHNDITGDDHIVCAMESFW